jgi:hypothetical protein
MAAKGVQILTLDSLQARKLPRPIRYPTQAAEQIALRNGIYASVKQAEASREYRRGNGRVRVRGGAARNRKGKGRTSAGG